MWLNCQLGLWMDSLLGMRPNCQLGVGVDCPLSGMWLNCQLEGVVLSIECVAELSVGCVGGCLSGVWLNCE